MIIALHSALLYVCLCDATLLPPLLPPDFCIYSVQGGIDRGGRDVEPIGWLHAYAVAHLAVFIKSSVELGDIYSTMGTALQPSGPDSALCTWDVSVQHLAPFVSSSLYWQSTVCTCRVYQSPS